MSQQTATQSQTGVRCGNRIHAEKTYHVNIDAVRACCAMGGNWSPPVRQIQDEEIVRGVLNQLRGHHGRVAAAMERTSSTRNAPAAPLPVTEAGMYRTPAGEIFKVQVAVHGSGQLYAKRLDSDTKSFEYAPGALRQLTADMRMTLAQAKEYGALYGVCCVCSRTLTDEKSIEAGIGPVCASRI